MNINRSTLSLLENGKQAPTLKILEEFCNKARLSPNSFFIKENNCFSNKLISELPKVDQPKLLNILEKIKIKEKYISFNRRCE